jgi:hypothetical protein
VILLPGKGKAACRARIEPVLVRTVLFTGEAMMAKKAANAEFNMAEAIRDVLTANPKVSSREAVDAIQSKYPSAKINRNSFSVAFYTGRKKLGMGSSGRRGRIGRRVGRGGGASHNVNVAKLQAAARFLSEVGSAEAAMEAIKLVQAIQVR